MASSNFLSEKSEQTLQHGIEVPQEAKHPLKTASITFFSFVIVGFVPLVPFLVAFFVPSAALHQFGFSMILTGAAFVGIGAVRGIVTRHRALRSAFETLFVGSLAAVISFAVGYFLRDLAVGI